MNMAKPHGGVLINRFLDKGKSQKLKNSNLQRICAGEDFILDIEKIAIGAYSPLKGFMSRDDFSEVVHNMRLADGTAWTIPIFLPVEGRVAGKLSVGDRIIICDKNDRDIALMEISDIFTFPKDKWVKKVYSTECSKHPGVNKIYSTHEKRIGGYIWMISRPSLEFEKYNMDPLQTRQLIRERGWKTVAGFQTRNVPHRAHEYLQKLALSVTDGILIHPIIGWKKDGDFLPSVIVDAYKVLIEKYFPPSSAIFAGLATAMRYAGPREAVFHAIIRKNYGCTHFIVGRDHAGVGGYYDNYEAHRIFDNFPDIGIVPLLLRGPYYCERCQEVVSDKICPHPEKWHRHISGTIIRELISKNKKIAPYLMRPEVVNVVMEYKKKSNSRKGWAI